MSDAVKVYKKRSINSEKIFKKSLKQHINGVQHNIRFFEPFPFVVKSAKGTDLIDVDSNKYTDYWMGHWSLILGHAPKETKSALQSQIKEGWMYGTVNRNTIELSELIQKHVKVAEKIRYATTGTEATMYAVRLARSKTGKKIIAKIDGGWHGYTSDLLKTVNWPFNTSESSGLVEEQDIISIPFNDLEESIKILNFNKDDLAGIIIEPILGGGGAIPAIKQYLLGIQEFAKKNNIVFMLDEIVTGFRFRFGCLYPTMGLDPDLVTLGKIVGGGMPIGVMCGKEELMSLADTKINSKEVRSYIGGGTFSANPLSMASGHSTLSILKNKGNSFYEKISVLGKFARRELEKVFDGRVITTGKDSLFMTHFVKNGITEIQDARTAALCDSELLKRYHFELISKNNIFFLPGKLGAISDAHSKSDIKKLISATQNFVTKI